LNPRFHAFDHILIVDISVYGVRATRWRLRRCGRPGDDSVVLAADSLRTHRCIVRCRTFQKTPGNHPVIELLRPVVGVSRTDVWSVGSRYSGTAKEAGVIVLTAGTKGHLVQIHRARVACDGA